MSDISLRCFTVQRCGYFHRGTFGACDMNETFESLKKWVEKAQNIQQTVTFQPKKDSDYLSVLCYDMATMDDDYLFTAWNILPGETNQVKAINGNKQVGSTDVKISKYPKDYIPGIETYFWIIPSKKIFFTVRLDSTYVGTKNFSNYINGFLKRCTKYCTPITVNNEQVMCYTIPNANSTDIFTPCFAYCGKRNPSNLQWLKDNRLQIKKYLRYASFDVNNPEELDIWQKLVRRIGLTYKHESSYSYACKIEYPYTPTKKELENIISDWKNNNIEEKIGFEMADQKIFWLDSMLVSGKFDINVTMKDGIATTSSLLKALEENKNDIFTRLAIR